MQGIACGLQRLHLHALATHDWYYLDAHAEHCCWFVLLLPTGLISASAATGAGSSYGALVRHTIGSKAEHILQYAVLANCYIMEVVFVVVLGDILVGTAPDYGGVLPEWTGLDPASCFWLRRDVVLAALSLLVLLPLAAMRSMAKLAIVNILGGWWAAGLVGCSSRALQDDGLQGQLVLVCWGLCSARLCWYRCFWVSPVTSAGQ